MFKNLSVGSIGTSGHESELIELALSRGFRGLELDLLDLEQRAKAAGLDKVRRRLDSSQLRLGYFRLPIEWDESEEQYQAGLARLAELAPIAETMKCTRALVEIAPANDHRPYHENFELHRKRLKQLGETLAPRGIQLGVGFRAAAARRRERSFEFIHDFAATQVLVGMVGLANVGLVVDLWELAVGGGGVDDLKKLGPGKVVALFLSDVPAGRTATELAETDCLLPAVPGTIDAVAAVTTLAEKGYDGPVTVRADRTAIAAKNRDELVKTAAESLDQVWKAVGLSPTGKLSAKVAQ